MNKQNKRFIIDYLHGSGFAFDYPNIYKELIEDLKNPLDLKASIPDTIKKWLELKSGDKLEWKMDVIDHKEVCIVSKKGSHSTASESRND